MKISLSLFVVCISFCAFAQNQKAGNISSSNFDEQEFRKMALKDGVDPNVIDKAVAERKLASQKVKNLSPVKENKKSESVSLNALCGDMGGENGWSSWQASTGDYSSGMITYNMTNIPPKAPRFVLTSGTGIDSCTPGPLAGSPALPVVPPGFGNVSIQLGQLMTNGIAGGCNQGCVERLTYTFTVTKEDTNFTYAYAVILENPLNIHTGKEVPYAEIYILDQAGNIISASHQKYAGDTTGTDAIPPGSFAAACAAPGTTMYDVVYKPWSTIGVNLHAYIGQSLTVVIINADCALGGHFCHSYWDFSCSAMNVSTVSTPDTCSGNKGTATVTPFGGTAPFTYLWNNGQTTRTATGLSSGTYTITVHDANNLSSISSVQVNNLIVTSSVSAFPVSCNGGSDGKVVITANGGVPPYSYLWNNNQTTQTATGLSAGNYSVTVTDSKGCSSTSTVSITQPAVLTSTITSSINVSCNGLNNGSAAVNASGGTPAYKYLWNTNQTGSSLTGLFAGNYSVTVTDAKGCTATVTVAVTQPVALTFTTVITNADCGSNNGSADVDVSGGTGSYKYLWNNGQTTPSLTGLAAGSYSVKITDGKGCTKSTYANISNIGSPTVAISSLTNVSCNGGNNGSASVTASGGNMPYTYSWCNGQTTSSVTGLSASTCNIFVTDNAGCISVSTINITQPAALTTTFTVTAVSCFGGNNGSVTVNVSGGTLPYTYLWNNNQTTQTATGLSTGNYTVTVTDFNGCLKNAVVGISQPTIITSTVSSLVVSCYGGNNGSATVNTSGGTPSYMFLWSNNQTTQTATGLSAGNYSVTVTDLMGCTKTSTVSVTQSPVLTPVITYKTDVICYGASNGNIAVSVSGGSTPYTYVWNNSKTTQVVYELSPGNYSVIITDAKGCTATLTTTITQPAALAWTTSVTNAGCGSNDGTAGVVVSGGILPYKYTWNDWQTTSTATGLSAGSYSMILTDGNACRDTAFANVSNIGSPTVTVSSLTNVSCKGGNNGSASVTASGGNVPYTYSWSNGQTSSSATGLSAGSYNLSVTDNAGCVSVNSINITQPAAALTTSLTSINVVCFGESNGIAPLSTSGGTPPYSYLWSNGQTAQTATGLISGSYSVVVTDGSGCSTVLPVSVPGSPMLVKNITSTTASCSNCPDGSAQENVTGGTPPYTYKWSSLQTTATITGLLPGSYTVCVTDARSCQVCDSIHVWWGVGVKELMDANSFSIYPNPSSGNLTLDFGSKDFGKAEITFSDLVGRALDKKLMNASRKQTMDISNLAEGIYVLRLETGYGTATKKIMVYKAHLF